MRRRLHTAAFPVHRHSLPQLLLDGALVADRMAALDRGAATCLDIADRKPETEQERNVATRFAVDPAQAKKILAVAKSNLCLE